MSTPDEKRVIDRLNKKLAKRGAKSRYVDSAPEKDWTFSEDVHASAGSPMADVPEHLQKRAAIAEKETLEELKARGILDEGYRVHGQPNPKLPRKAMVKKLIEVHKVLGFGFECYEEELAQIQQEEIDAQQQR